MDWNLAIERNREALKRIVAMLVAMAELGNGPSAMGSRPYGPGPAQAAESPASPDCLLPIADCRPTLPRHLHRAILRLIRPAESAVRRLIIVMARGLVVTLPPLRPRKPKPASIFLKKPGGTGILLPRGAHVSGFPSPLCGVVGGGGPAARALALPLLDPLRSRLSLSKGRPGPKRPAATGLPRISLPGVTAPSPVAPRLPPAPDDLLDANRLAQRLAALGAALDDLPAQARRFARWQARRHISRNRRTWPLRPGRPPGQPRAIRRTHEVHEILHDLHGLAFDLLERPDTS